jgi:hypothetical protein
VVWIVTYHSQFLGPRRRSKPPISQMAFESNWRWFLFFRRRYPGGRFPPLPPSSIVIPAKRKKKKIGKRCVKREKGWFGMWHFDGRSP